MITAALKDICSVTIIAYYSTNSDVQSHIFQPPNEASKTCLGLSFVNGHDDLVVDQIDNTRNIVSAFPESEHVEVLITDSSCKTTVMEDDVKQEIIKKERTSSIDFSEEIYMFSDAEDRGRQDNWGESTDSNTNTSVTKFVNGNENPKISDVDLSEHHEHDESPIKFKGPRRYINNPVFENVSVQYVENVPVDIDRTLIYVVQEISNGELKACKAGRPWYKTQSSNIKEYTKGPRLPLNLRGGYICKNKNCKNIGNFGINQREFSYKNENVVCSIWGVDASYIRYDARLILERNVEKKIITCKHHGRHTCAVELKG